MAQLTNWHDVRIFRSWAAYDSSFDWPARRSSAQRHINWSSVLGIGMAAAVSAGFWAVVGAVIAHFWG